MHILNVIKLIITARLYKLFIDLQKTEKRYAKRKMEQESSHYIYISNWKKDKFFLQYPDKFESWEICHLGDDEVRSTFVT